MKSSFLPFAGLVFSAVASGSPFNSTSALPWSTVGAVVPPSLSARVPAVATAVSNAAASRTPSGKRAILLSTFPPRFGDHRIALVQAARCILGARRKLATLRCARQWRGLYMQRGIEDPRHHVGVKVLALVGVLLAERRVGSTDAASAGPEPTDACRLRIPCERARDAPRRGAAGGEDDEAPRERARQVPHRLPRQGRPLRCRRRAGDRRARKPRDLPARRARLRRALEGSGGPRRSGGLQLLSYGVTDWTITSPEPTSTF